MIPQHPASLYRPTKIDQGHGTYSETLVGPRTIYVVITVHENLSVVISHRYTDIRPEDQIVSDGAAYRVTGSMEVLGTDSKRNPIERIDKPIVPLIEDLSGS